MLRFKTQDSSFRNLRKHTFTLKKKWKNGQNTLLTEIIIVGSMEILGALFFV